MPEPKLTREVELPRPRSSGAAVVAVASLAMFTAVGASAFVVRVRMAQDDLGARAMVSRPDCAHARASFLTAAHRGDIAEALDIYADDLESGGGCGEQAQELLPLRRELSVEYRTGYLDEQLEKIAADLARGQCGLAYQRLAGLRHRLPDDNLSLNTVCSEAPPLGK